MTPERIQERYDFLIGFLDLPKKWRLVTNLSGGQQRSVVVSYSMKKSYKSISIRMAPSAFMIINLTEVHANEGKRIY